MLWDEGFVVDGFGFGGGGGGSVVPAEEDDVGGSEEAVLAVGGSDNFCWRISWNVPMIEGPESCDSDGLADGNVALRS